MNQVALAMPLRWPSAMEDLFSSDAKVGTVQPNIIMLDCLAASATSSIRPLFVVTVSYALLPFLVVLCAGCLMYTVLWCHRVACSSEKNVMRIYHDRHWTTPGITVALVAIFMVHAPVAAQVSRRLVRHLSRSIYLTPIRPRLFACESMVAESPDRQIVGWVPPTNAQRLVLYHDMLTACGSREHVWWVICLGVPLTIGFVMGMPMLAYWFLTKHEKAMS